MSEVRVGVDFGGTKIEAVALAPDGRELGRKRAPTPRDSYDGSVAAVVALVEEIEAIAGCGAGPVGLGMPGAISPSRGVVMNANSTWLNDRPFARDLEAALARPLRVENDANCLALSEAIDGAGAGAEVVFAVILGTGVGGGWALRGSVWRGANAIAGEWGHARLPEPTDDERPGPACYCGRRGCVETWLSGPGFAADYARAGAAAVSAEEVSRRAQEGEARAQAARERYFERLARALTPVINTVDPDAIVFGGGLSRTPGLVSALAELLPGRIFADDFRTKLALSVHGDSSGVRGAARLWPLDATIAPRNRPPRRASEETER